MRIVPAFLKNMREKCQKIRIFEKVLNLKKTYGNNIFYTFFENESIMV